MKKWYVKFKGRGYLKAKSSWVISGQYYSPNELSNIPKNIYSREVSGAKVFDTKAEAVEYYEANVNRHSVLDKLPALKNLSNVLSSVKALGSDYNSKANKAKLTKLNLSSSALAVLCNTSYWSMTCTLNDIKIEGISKFLKDVNSTIKTIESFSKRDKLSYSQEEVDYKVYKDRKHGVTYTAVATNSKGDACNCCGVAVENKKLINMGWKFQVCKMCIEGKLTEMADAIPFSNAEKETYQRTLFMHNL